MSDVTETDVGGAATGTPKKGGKKLLLIGGVAAGLLVAAGGGAYVLMGSDMGSPDAGAETSALPQVYFHDLPQITVNLSGGSGQGQYLRAQIALELSDPGMLDHIEPRMARVLDTFQIYLRELRRSDLEGSAGIYRLKEELLRRVNQAVYPASVDDVLFKELLIQ